MQNKAEILAEYFTNNFRVVHASMALGVGGVQSDEAKAFFEVRKALGITGYMTKEEAIQLLSVPS